MGLIQIMRASVSTRVTMAATPTKGVCHAQLMHSPSVCVFTFMSLHLISRIVFGIWAVKCLYVIVDPSSAWDPCLLVQPVSSGDLITW